MGKIIKTVRSWKGLSKIMNDRRFNKEPIEMNFKEDVLISLTFKTTEVKE